jgi:E3 ubiquitin-protein ligase RNF139
MGATSGVLFFILALQTGLLGMSPDQKLWGLYRNFCLLLTAVLHFTHGLMHPLLMSLSASQSISIAKHWRALTVAAVLLILPSFLLKWLWELHSLSTWLLAMTAFSVEIIIKTSVSLLIYLIFMFDAYYSLQENLDDYVYYIQASCSSFEFLCGIFLFCNGAWIVLFESGGIIRALMMAIHAYLNIFEQAKKGWHTYMLRRTAVRKISLLEQVTPQQLLDHNDVCAICFQDLNSARITPCRHLFHGVCLRKWLYVRDECPICHTRVCPASEERQTDEES